MNVIDIADLTRRALSVLGCNESLVGSFDGHSTIELELLNLPSLNVERVEDDVWLWSQLPHCSALQVENHAAPLLAFLIETASVAQGAQMQLADINGRIELRTLLGPSTLHDEYRFGQALEAFYTGLETVNGILS
ncbi:MAG: Invasion protein B family [Pseudomonas sp.]|jgi:hypothetical protein|uniref:InvB/SpaK family type III secretion system chaperone n=1 Tax=Pseudomonas sp. TaxID=306 RepID=UPI0023A5BC0D|nr:Invasion protein B family [Pseudomonas sp.]MDE1196451.1 Invasion protein B family [Pseudomonas sp.]